MLHTIESRFGEIDGRIVADIGCGTGRLMIGAAMLGARLVVLDITLYVVGCNMIFTA